MEVRVALLDDDSRDLRKICEYFESVSGQLKYECSCFEKDEPSFYERYDLYVIDIELSDTSGLEVAQKIRGLYPEAVLMLNSKRNDLVFESFKIGCFFFVRKDHFTEDMGCAQIRLNQYFSVSKKKYAYQSKKYMRSIPYENIEYIEKVNHQIEIHLDSHEVLKERKSLKSIMGEIDSPFFIQCHQSYYVNLAKVKKIEHSDFIIGNSKVQISRRYLAEVRKEYMSYLSSCLSES